MFIETLKKIDRVFKKLGFDNYAIIGGIAVRYYTQMPRFTKDIDLIIDKEMSVGDWDKFKALFDAKSSQHGEVPDVLGIISTYTDIDLIKLHRGLVEEEYPENRFSNLTGDDKKRWEIVEAKIKEKLWK